MKWDGDSLIFKMIALKIFARPSLIMAFAVMGAALVSLVLFVNRCSNNSGKSFYILLYI